MNKKSVFILIVFFFVAGCQPSENAVQTAIAQTQAAMPTETPRPTNTALPAATVTPTETPNLTATAVGKIYEIATVQAQWEPSLNDPFTDNIFDWCNYSTARTLEDGAKTRFYFDNGAYHIAYTSGDKNPQIWCAPFGTYYDFQVSVLAKLISGDPETSYGVVFRLYHESNRGLSRFTINPANEYRVDIRDSNNNWTILQDWTKSEDIKPLGEWNKITISAVGPVFTFYINDKFQTSLINSGQDDGKGSIGLVVNSDAPRKSIEVLFDDMIIREP